MRTWILTTAAAAALGGCAMSGADMAPMGSSSAQAQLRDATGRSVANATVTQQADGLAVAVTAAGMQPGTHGIHVHAVGRCDAPGFTSAGPHWNPTERQHGLQDPRGPHRGDLPNLIVGANGQGTLRYLIRGGQLSGGAGALLDADGAALVIHARADDMRTDPSGNSGDRIACGVFR